MGGDGCRGSVPHLSKLPHFVGFAADAPFVQLAEEGLARKLNFTEDRKQREGRDCGRSTGFSSRLGGETGGRDTCC
jgi:hypothetical protein